MSLLLRSVVTISVLWVIYRVATLISGWRFNIAEARRSGLPYIVTPFSPVFLPWQLSHKILSPIITTLLPRSLWEDWLDLITPESPFRTGYAHFKRKGDLILMASPGQLYLFVCNAEAIRTIAARRESFPKWTETYEILRIFGENVLTSEGSVWKMHRKITSASFNERNTALVFRESIRQAQGLVRMWTRPDAKKIIESLEADTNRLALNIIGYVGFGLRLPWPGETLADEEDPTLAKYGSHEALEGHAMSFADAMQTILEHILILLIFPAKLLRYLPFQKPKTVGAAYFEFKRYMDELLSEKMSQAQKGARADEGMDLMGQLARSSVEATRSDVKAATLTRDEIIGNAFIMLVAGHETTANAIHFTLAELAINPRAQRRLQKDLDELVGSTDPQSWDYEALVNPLMASMAGAAMNETLRLFPASIEVPKKVAPDQDQVLTVDGKQYIVPADTVVSLVIASVHRHPRYWPSKESKIRPGEDDIWDYDPDRWFPSTVATSKSNLISEPASEVDAIGESSSLDTSAQLFRPERGAYIPFSDGPRSCLGRRMAQVEVIATLAVLFRDYSVELAVDEDAGENDAARYRAAQEKNRRTLAQATSIITLKLHGELSVPVRLVKRGEERFVSWVDE